MFGMKPIRLRVHHALNFAQWVMEGKSDADLRRFLRENKYDKGVIEVSVKILQQFRNPGQKVRILEFRDVDNDEVCRACEVKKRRLKCNLPPSDRKGDKDAYEAQTYEVYPSALSTTSGEVQRARPRRRGFFR